MIPTACVFYPRRIASPMNTPRRPQPGFTLIELLVVISIIALLIAILLPTLTAARHQARLTHCATKMRQIAIGVHAYATENEGYFPYRAEVPREPHFLKTPASGLTSPYDHRTQLRPYFSSMTSMFGDPLAPQPIEMDRTTAARIHASYDLWYNYPMESGGKGLERTDQIEMRYQNNGFDVIVADRLAHYGSSNYSYASHEFGAPGSRNVTAQGTGDVLSLWHYVGGEGIAPPPERNFAHADGHVSRLGDLKPDDPRLVRVPLGPRHNVAVSWTFLPARQ